MRGAADLEIGDPAGQQLDLAAQALEVVEHARLLEQLTHASGGCRHVLDEILRAAAAGLRALGGRLERALDGAANGLDRVGSAVLVLLLALLVFVFFRHGAMSLVPSGT
jgi:hypothetical protein